MPPGFFLRSWPLLARFYGGFLSLEEGASLSCEGGTIQKNHAGEAGGAIYSRFAGWVNCSCAMVGNGAPQGAAVYVTHTTGGVVFESTEISENVAPGGSVMYLAESSIVARGVTFEDNLSAGVGLFSVRRSSFIATGVSFQLGWGLSGRGSNDRALHLEDHSTLVAEGCVFGGWMSDAMVYSTNPAAGSLVLNSCDFAESSPVMAVSSPNSDAEIRNAIVSLRTIENAATANNSLVLVDRALECSDSNACGPGVCVDSALGVVCACFEDGSCLDGGGALSVNLDTPPGAVTYSPDPVFFELMVSAAVEGTTPTAWNLTAFEADGLALEVFPASGVLASGENVSVAVTGTPVKQDVGGNLVSRFVVTSLGSRTSDSIEVHATFYLCGAFEFAMPLNSTGTGSVVCEQCVAIDGEEGVDCELPGATLTTLPIRRGFWRSSPTSWVVHSCLHSESCAGASEVSNSDDYCADGYEGPCESQRMSDLRVSHK